LVDFVSQLLMMMMMTMHLPKGVARIVSLGTSWKMRTPRKAPPYWMMMLLLEERWARGGVSRSQIASEAPGVGVG
jgi:hypothetical protein